MYLKEMSPVEKAIITHLKHLGHYNGVSLRKFDNVALDYLVKRIINDEVFCFRPASSIQWGLYNGRQCTEIHNEKWFKKFLKEREKWQLKEHGRMGVLGKDLDTEELTKTNLTMVGIAFGGKIKKLQRTLDVGMMTHLNLQNLMTEDEYGNYYLKNCINVLY